MTTHLTRISPINLVRHRFDSRIPTWTSRLRLSSVRKYVLDVGIMSKGWLDPSKLHYDSRYGVGLLKTKLTTPTPVTSTQGYTSVLTLGNPIQKRLRLFVGRSTLLRRSTRGDLTLDNHPKCGVTWGSHDCLSCETRHREGSRDDPLEDFC